MYEKQMVKETLEEHQEQDYRLDEQMASSLGRDLDMVLDVIHTKNKDAFQMAKNMVLVLYDILTAKDESEFEGYKGSFDKEQFAALLELYSLGKTEGCYRDILVELHETFSGRCLSLAVSNNAFHKKQLSLAQNNPNSVNILPELRAQAEKAQKAIKNVNDFIEKYDVPSGAPKFKMKW